MNLAYYFYDGLGNISMARLIVCRQDFFDNLGKQSEKSERCQSHARVSGEPSHGLGFVLPILRTLQIRSGQRLVKIETYSRTRLLHLVVSMSKHLAIHSL